MSSTSAIKIRRHQQGCLKIREVMSNRNITINNRTFNHMINHRTMQGIKIWSHQEAHLVRLATNKIKNNSLKLLDCQGICLAHQLKNFSTNLMHKDRATFHFRWNKSREATRLRCSKANTDKEWWQMKQTRRAMAISNNLEICSATRLYLLLLQHRVSSLDTYQTGTTASSSIRQLSLRKALANNMNSSIDRANRI